MNTDKLGDLVRITIGRTPSRSNSDLWDKNGEAANVWLSIADLLNAEGKVVSDSKEYITDIAAKAFDMVPKGTLLVSFKLTLGRLAFAGQDLRTNEAIAALRNDESKILNEYLYYFLSHFDWMSYAAADKKVKGFTLNKAKLYEIEISYPESLEEQRRIVAKLDVAFEKIHRATELTQENIKHTEALSQSALAHVFSKLSSPKIDQLGNVYDVRDGTHDSPKYQKEGYPLVTSKNLKTGTLSMENVKYISDFDYLKINERSKVDKGDVLMAMIGTIGNPIIVEFNPEFAIKNVALFKPLNGHDGRFLKYYLQSGYAKRKMNNDAKGTTQRFVSLGYLRSFDFPVVNLEQESLVIEKLDKIAQATEALDAAYSTKLAMLASLKHSMLNQAFSESAVK